MCKIYQEETPYSPVKDSKYIADKYSEYAVDMANCLAKLVEMKEHIDYLHDLTADNGDVGMDLERAITYLGIALGSCTTYGKEYLDETNATENLDKDNNND